MKKIIMPACLMACMLCFGTQARASTCETPEYETEVFECYRWIIYNAVDNPFMSPNTAFYSLNSIRAIAEHQGESLPLLSEAVAEVIDLLREHGDLEESEAYAKSFYQLALCHEASTSESKAYLEKPDFKDITLNYGKRAGLIMAFGATLIKKLSDPDCQSSGEAILKAMIEGQQVGE